MKSIHVAVLSALALLCAIYGSTTAEENDLCETTCTCASKTGHVLCAQRDIQTFPSVTSFSSVSNIQLLDLSRNEIKKLDKIEEIDGLKTLLLPYNKIESIESNAFEKYNFLENLDLSNNQMVKITVDALYGLEGLRVLNISMNFFHRLPDTLFHEMPRLKELHLHGNPLHMLRYELLQESEELVYLDVSNAAIEDLDNTVFHSLLKLEYLDISGNHFTTFPKKAIQSARTLKHLKMNRILVNKIQEADFIKMSYLETLEISDNQNLNMIERGAFSGLTTLKVLKMNSNPNLHYLDFGAFSGLYSPANLSWSLQELYLRSNGLRAIESPSSALCYIGVIDLQGNPWTCDCNMKWISHCTLRSELYADLTCASPQRHDNSLIRELEKEDFVCESSEMLIHQQKVLRIIVIASGLVGIFFCALIIILVIKKDKIFEWWQYRKRGSGAVYYVKAQSNGGDV